jgi:uncharacterized protein (TIRG00374 family)
MRAIPEALAEPVLALGVDSGHTAQVTGLRSAATWLRTRPRWSIALAQLGMLGLAVWLLVVPQVRRSSGSLNLLFDMDSVWLIVAIVAELVSLGAYALATRSMLPRTSRPSLLRVLRIDLSAIALGHCVPDGGAAGTALAWRLLVAAGVPSAEAVFAKLAQGLLAAVVLQAMLVGAFALGLTSSDLGRWNTVPAALSVSVLLIAVLVILVLRRPGVRQALVRGLARLPRYGAQLAAGTTRLYRRHAVQQLRATFATPRHALFAAAFVAANWALDAVALWASVSAYGPGVGLEGLAAAFAIQTFAAWLPVTPSGLGISDGLMIPALIAFGASSTSAVLGVLTWRVLAYWLPLPIGAVAYGSLRVARPRAARVSAE